MKPRDSSSGTRLAIQAWLRTASEPVVVRRALKYAIVVGAVLITINHGDALLRGELDALRLFRIGLTVVVPYCVSTASSVAAMRPTQLSARTMAKQTELGREGRLLKHLLTFTTLLLAFSAIGYLLFPAAMLSIVGLKSNPNLDFLLRTTGAGLLALVPGAWAARRQTASPVAYAMIIGLIGYLLLSSVVDFYAYTQSIVNGTSIPSIAFRLLLAGVIAFLARRQRQN
jgi:hypothetical protein